MRKATNKDIARIVELGSVHLERRIVYGILKQGLVKESIKKKK